MAPAKRPFRPLLAPVLAYVFRPISAVEEQIREADTRLQKAAAVAASPFLFLYHAFYASSNGAAHGPLCYPPLINPNDPSVWILIG